MITDKIWKMLKIGQFIMMSYDCTSMELLLNIEKILKNGNIYTEIQKSRLEALKN